MFARTLRAKLGGVLLGTALVVAPASTHTLLPHADADGERILITGDSITHGSSGDYTWRYRLWNKLRTTAPGVSFVGPRSDLYDNVADTYGSQHYAIGFPGNRHGARWGGSFQVDGSGISSMVSSTIPDVLVVMLGSNDLAYLTSPAQTIANLRTYINRARAARPGLDVVVGEVVNRYDPWNDAHWLTPQADEYANRLSSLAAELDTAFERVVVATTRTGWNAKTMTWDGSHPNPTGEALIAQHVSAALVKLGIGTVAPNISGSYDWDTAGPAANVNPGVERANISWNRRSSGATGMFIWARVVNDDANPSWDKWPYAVPGDVWHAEQLVPNGKYEFRLVPAKGSMVGQPGPKVASHVGSLPVGPGTALRLQPGRNADQASVMDVSWGPATNATAFLLATRNVSRSADEFSTLPYPFAGNAWTFSFLEPGVRYNFRVTPTRGYATGTPSRSGPTRTWGVPGNIAHAVLGDSYSAGLGSTNPEESDDDCMRSIGGWPRHFADLYVTARSLIACSSTTSAHVRNIQIPKMSAFFANHPRKAQVVTLTTGGNDVRFGSRLEACLRGDCTVHEAAIIQEIDDLVDDLANVYGQIRQAAPHADIIVGGYPGLVQVGGQANNACRLIREDERRMINAAATRLNSRIASAASVSGVWSVGQRVRDLFEGHNACTQAPDEWIHAVNGEWGGELFLGLVDAKSFHPNNTGQFWYSSPFADAYAYYAR